MFEFYCCGKKQEAYVDGKLYSQRESVPWKERGTITCPKCFSDWKYVGKEEKEEVTEKC